MVTAWSTVREMARVSAACRMASRISSSWSIRARSSWPQASTTPWPAGLCRWRARAAVRPTFSVASTSAGRLHLKPRPKRCRPTRSTSPTPTRSQPAKRSSISPRPVRPASAASPRGGATSSSPETTQTTNRSAWRQPGPTRLPAWPSCSRPSMRPARCSCRSTPRRSPSTRPQRWRSRSFAATRSPSRSPMVSSLATP